MPAGRDYKCFDLCGLAERREMPGVPAGAQGVRFGARPSPAAGGATPATFDRRSRCNAGCHGGQSAITAIIAS